MKLVITMPGKNHDMIAIYQESNNFGDQRLLYRFESHDGTIIEHVDTFQEGEWVASDEALAIACSIFKTHYNDVDKKYHEHYKIFNF